MGSRIGKDALFTWTWRHFPSNFEIKPGWDNSFFGAFSTLA